MNSPGTGSELEQPLSATQKLDCMARLAGGVAHDFNNLLTAIVGGCELMAAREQRQGTSGKDSLLQMIKDAADRAAALTRQLALFSRRQHLAATAFDLNAAVAAAHASLRRLLPEDTTVETIIGKDTGRILGDPDSLQQVLTNLALNARDAMPSGGTFTIETRRSEVGERLPGLPECVPPGAYALCSVTDTGCGMTEEVRARMCEPFFTTKDSGKGTGLGLASVYGIVKQSAGFIQVKSKPGRGSTFNLYYPLATAGLAAAPVAIRPPRRFCGGRTVLLVDDEDAVRAIASQGLARDQFTVLEARDGDEALRVSRRWPQAIHVMVTDVMMPRMNGRQLAEQIAPERPEMRVLFMSGYTDEAVITSKGQGPSMPFLPKPFTTDGLVLKVRALLAG
jgi:nitrogen-specific signal transduction histidine kinase/CheY-like chemotaxis protein